MPEGARSLPGTAIATANSRDAGRRRLVLRIASEPDQTSRQYDELWQRSLAAVGIKVDFQKQKWPDLFKAARAGQLQLWALGLNSTVGDYYMQQFFGPSAGEANLGRFRNADFDALFIRSRRVPEGSERAALYAKMTDIVAAYAPWCPHAFRVGSTVVAAAVRGYKKNVYYPYPPWQYLDIAPRWPATIPHRKREFPRAGDSAECGELARLYHAMRRHHGIC